MNKIEEVKNKYIDNLKIHGTQLKMFFETFDTRLIEFRESRSELMEDLRSINHIIIDNTKFIHKKLESFGLNNTEILDIINQCETEFFKGHEV